MAMLGQVSEMSGQLPGGSQAKEVRSYVDWQITFEGKCRRVLEGATGATSIAARKEE
jgi:hypothetical protein